MPPNEKKRSILTRIDQILIGDTGMIHVVDGGGEEGREHLHVILKIRAKKFASKLFTDA